MNRNGVKQISDHQAGIESVISKLAPEEQALIKDAIAARRMPSVIDLWEQPDLSISYWILLTTGVNHFAEMGIASELLCWKHFFGKSFASIRCIQSSDVSDAGCCLGHFGEIAFPTLLVGSSNEMSDFIAFGPSILNQMAHTQGAIHFFATRLHQWLLSGLRMQEIFLRLESTGIWNDPRVGLTTIPNCSIDGIRTSWSGLSKFIPSTQMSRVRWKLGDFGALVQGVDVNADGIESLLSCARVFLGTGFGDVRSLLRVDAEVEIASAVYESIRGNTQLHYEYEPVSPTVDVQELRLAREVLATGFGTCVDFALLFASVLEQAGLAPAIIVLSTKSGFHALGGFFINGSELDVEHVTSNPEEIIALVSSNKLMLVETVGLSSSRGRKKTFERACTEASGLFQLERPVAIINVRAARKTGHFPPT